MPRQANSNAQPANEQQNAQKKNYEYKPSLWVMNRVKEFPFKEDLKRIYGVDLESMLANPKEYGILESFASSNFTLVPIEMKINEKEAFIKECIDRSRGKDGFNETEQRAALQKWVPDTGVTSGFFTMRLWYLPGTDRWGVDKHEVHLGKKVGEDGQVISKDNGEEKLTWDTNPLRENSAIKLDGKVLSKDQMDHLRLTGTLGDAVDHESFNKENQKVLLFVDEYNNHELIVINVNYNKAQLESRLGSKNYIHVDGQGEAVYSISKDDNSMSIAAAGGYIWVTNIKDPSDKINVWFDPRNRKFRPTIKSNPKLDYDMARKKEIAAAQKQTKSAQVKTPSKGKSQSK